MTIEEKALLRLALSVMSGRVTVEDISSDQFSLLGYDVYKFRYYGSPSMQEIQTMCEDIVFNTLEKAAQS